MLTHQLGALDIGACLIVENHFFRVSARFSLTFWPGAVPLAAVVGEGEAVVPAEWTLDGSGVDSEEGVEVGITRDLATHLRQIGPL